MKRTDRTILLVLPLLALLIAFYLLAVSPRQKQLSDLDGDIATLQGRVSTAEDEAAMASDARKAFARNYAAVVSMGNAVPEDSDQATLIYDLTEAGKRSDVRFRSFELDDSGSGAAASSPAPASASGTSSSGTDGSSGSSSSSSTVTTTSVPATEAAAAVLPIGATVGSAGLPVMPYKLRFSGSFFHMADFFADLDKSVDIINNGGDPEVSGRLMTINGFAMVGDPIHGFPMIQASMSVNTYVTPGDQGLSAGASPAGPAPIGSPTSTSTTAAAGTPTGVPGTATVTP